MCGYLTRFWRSVKSLGIFKEVVRIETRNAMRCFFLVPLFYSSAFQVVRSEGSMKILGIKYQKVLWDRSEDPSVQ